MKIEEIHSFEDLKQYLEHFTCWRDDEHIYDFGGVMTLFLALLGNLQRNSIDGDIEDIGGYFTEEQRKFLKLLSESAENFPNDSGL